MTAAERRIATSVLVVGAGGWGLRAAVDGRLARDGPENVRWLQRASGTR